MARLLGLRRFWDSLMSSGAYPGESDIRRGKRRIVVGYLFFGVLTRLVFAAGQLSEGNPEGVVDLSAALVSVVALGALRIKPDWFVGIVNVMLFFQLVEVLAATVIDGGLVPSELVILFGLLSVLGALIVLSVRAAFGWLLAYGVTLVLAVVLPNWIEPLHDVEGSAGGMAGTVFGVTVFVFAGMAYFVRQRDRFQRESDDLLHNILPDEIARRLKAERTMIADDYESASVLFADVVNFTPMSAALSPPELVGLLNTVFTTFDAFVDELDLEKIKTVGDAYMVASGVPQARPDHAHAIAELALRIRDHTEHSLFDGHDIRLRIGINSGPVVAGIVGTHKFAYDLWGDVVNTASRMESEGIAGWIQVTPATYELIRDQFVCEPRGVVTVKGKGDMDTYVLVSRR
ncbi:MAG: adenylate/guanylate cyclase domain-containing protein, partial [Acidimicrobiia bacterium]|nr:adenylate/guanylate cyclase domain-containing protein [Acidimicrobiia bacterium]